MGQSKLVVLCDGTWCGRTTKSQTNISMLARLMGINVERGEDSRDDEGVQVRYFDGPGVGNSALDLMFTGSTSPDVAARCVDIYQYIVDRFTDKHEIWMFGLGRGAYIIRCVSGMISTCGIVKKTGAYDKTAELVHHVYSIYESVSRGRQPSPLQMDRIRGPSSWDVETPITFMGIIDTTDPASFSSLLPALAVSKHPHLYDMSDSRAVKNVYHAVSIHETLSLFSLCPFPAKSTEKTVDFPGIDEMWFPGMHYDLGRQRFPLALAVDAIGRLVPWMPGLMVCPNMVLSDLVLMWILSSIKCKDSTGTLVPNIAAEIHVIAGRLTTCGKESKGSGDVYAKIQPLVYAISFLAQLLRSPITAISGAMMSAGSWAHWLHPRKIPDGNAKTYDYKRPFDQSGLTVCHLADISKERYPSAAYEDYQLYRHSTGEIDTATYECLVGRESIDLGTPFESHGPTPLVTNWQGPDFYRDLGQENLEYILTITKVSHDGEYYVARTIPDFLNEFFGDLGGALLGWVTKLCVLKTRVSVAAAGEPQSKPSGENEPLLAGWVSKLLIPKARVTAMGKPHRQTCRENEVPSCRLLDKVHLHIDDHSITAYFADTSLRMTLPENWEANKTRLLSALSWVVAVFKPPKRDSRGLFKVECSIEGGDGDGDGGTEGVRALFSRSEEFSPSEKASSCWTQLFDYACVAEVPRGFHFEANGRPEGLEIDFDVLVGVSRASRPWVTEYGVVLFGFDTALIQLRPVESRRWHVVRTPDTLITPIDVLKAIKPADQSSMGGGDNEMVEVYKAIQSSLPSSTTAGEPGSKKTRGSIRSFIEDIEEKNMQQRAQLETFQYSPGNVYVGWCENPRVSIGAAEPDWEFLENFDLETGVPVVNDDILALANVTTVHTVGISARIAFLMASIGGSYSRSIGRQQIVQVTSVRHRFTHFRLQLRSAHKTPVILWDDSARRAWLLPADYVLFFVTICLVKLLRFDLARPFTYMTENPGASAEGDILANWDIELLGPPQSQPTGVTFGDFILLVWEGMEKAQSVCYASTNNRKHVKDGVVFGYDLQDLLGPGLIELRYLDCHRAGANLRAWEPLARKGSLHVVFCNSVGSVIECAQATCPGVPCDRYCRWFSGTEGVLSCLLPDLKRFFGRDWEDYPNSGILPVSNGFDWIPTSSTTGDIFNHRHRSSHFRGDACECCARLDRLQAVVKHREPSFFSRLWRKSRPLRNTLWLNQSYGVRFGKHITK